MQVIPVISLPKNKKTVIYKKLVRQSAEILKRGGVIVAPTDTIYGLLAKATDKKAVERIQKIKGRNKNKPMPVLVKDMEQAKRFCYLPLKTFVFSKKIWPGPYTLILKTRHKFPKGVVAKNGSIGMRVPDSRWLRDLIGEVGAPLVATSANISSRPEIKTIRQATKEFSKNKDHPDLMVNGGKIRSKPSVVVDLCVWPPKVLRNGGRKEFKLLNNLK